ncbi:MAG: type II secretion system minor pseudopilin GspI [Marinicaulis sp.]|nr:type II secretion system minor pseudopilin GspI [Marinicaulis sp.]NNE40101.1 type II secretion system minor pseudopilin GspI [Marinicaulis sp.]NNL88412.1 type II secretion system minor pseudopilin GspI [Marinicaulis sp.]
MAKRNRQEGITLVETLVALAVMGLTATAILVLIGQNTRFATDAREQTFAAIALDNLMVETLLDPNLNETGEEVGPVIYDGYEWNFRRTITDTPIDGIVRIDLVITDVATAQVIARATTLRGGES